jgi:hypothetical protein
MPLQGEHPVTPPEIRAAIEDLRHATSPLQRTHYERALLELARLVDLTVMTIDDEAKREMTGKQLHLINDLRTAVQPPDVITATRRPRLVQTPTPVEEPRDDLLALYCRVMGEVKEVFVKYEAYVVRGWDGMDGCWTDCTGEVGCEEALRVWAKRTDGGTRCVAYAEIDYCRIFPGGTRMHWDGAEGREMHR